MLVLPLIFFFLYDGVDERRGMLQEAEDKVESAPEA